MWYKVTARFAAPGRFCLQGKLAGIFLMALVAVIHVGLVAAQDGTPAAPQPEVTPQRNLLSLSVLPSEIPVLEGGTAEVFLLLDRYSSEGVTVGYVVYSRDYDTAVADEDYEGQDTFVQITFHKSAQINLTTLPDEVAEPMESFHFEVVAVSPGVLLGDLPSRLARIWIEDLPAVLATPTPDPNITPTPTPDPEATPEPTPTPWPTSAPIPSVPEGDAATPEPEPPAEPQSRTGQVMPWIALLLAVGGVGYWAYKKGWLDRWIQRKPEPATEEESEDDESEE